MNLFLITCRIPKVLARDYLLHTKEIIKISLEKNYAELPDISPGVEIIPSRVLDLMSIPASELLEVQPLVQEKLCSMHYTPADNKASYVLSSVVLNTSMEQFQRILSGNVMPGVMSWTVLAISDIDSHLAGLALNSDCSLLTANGIITKERNNMAVESARMDYLLRLKNRKRSYSVYPVLKYP